MNISSEIMQKEVCSVKADSSLKEAYLLMKGQDIRHLPVVDGEGKVVGIISDRDIQRAMEVNVINEFQQEVFLPSKYSVSHFMSWPVYTVRPSTPVEVVAKAMLTEKISAVVVENNEGKLTGILTTTDMLALLVDLLSLDPREASQKSHWTQWTLGSYLNHARAAI